MRESISLHTVSGLSLTLAADTTFDQTCLYYSLAKITATTAIAVYTNATGQVCSRVITASGSSITVGNITVVDSSGSANGTAVTVLDRCAVAAVITSGYLLKLIRLTISGTSVTAGAALTTAHSAGSSQGWTIAQICRVDAAAAAVTFRSASKTNAAIVMDSASSLIMSPITQYSSLNITLPKVICQNNGVFAASEIGTLQRMDAVLPRMIALNSASSGGEIDAAYDGNCECENLSEGTRITSPGVSGFAFAGGKLAVTGYWK